MRKRTNKFRRGKPAVAHRAENLAQKNLQRKLNALEYITGLANKLPPMEFLEKASSFPRSLRQFNSWEVDCEQATTIGFSGGLHRNSQDTVKKRDSLRLRIEHALKVLKETCKVVSSGEDSSESIQKKKFKNAIERSELLERELVELRQQNVALLKEKILVDKELANLKVRFSKEVSSNAGETYSPKMKVVSKTKIVPIK